MWNFFMPSTHTYIRTYTQGTIIFNTFEFHYREDDEYYEEDDDDDCDGFMPRKLFFFSFDHFKVNVYLMIS